MASKINRVDPEKPNAKRIKKKFKERSLAGKIVLGVVAAIIGIIAFVICAGLGIYVGIASSTPDISAINVSPTQYPSTIVDRNGKEIITLASSGSKRVDIEDDQITDNLKWAFIDIEDERFYEHNGVDLKGIIRAVYSDLREGKSEGASTLTQQLIKNNVFSTGQLERSTGSSLKRKIQEQILAIELEKTMSKDDILKTYLNTINLGGGNYGVVTAAEYYFGKNVEDLTLSECAVIAGITKNPTAYNPANHPENNRERQLAVLNKMLENGHITEAEYEEAVNDDVYSRITANTISGDTDAKYSYFVDALVSQLLEDFQDNLGYTYQQAYNTVFGSGLTIECTQDIDIQEVVDKEINDDSNYPSDISYSISWDLSIKRKNGDMEYYNQNNILYYHTEDLGDTSYKLNYASKEEAQAAVDEYKDYLHKKGDEITYEELIYTAQPQASFTIIDYNSGEVLAMSGGRGEKETNMSLNRATDSLRQPGSCFKPLAAYAPAMQEAGFTLATAIDDSPFNYGGDIDREVQNWWGDNYLGLTPVRKAIEQSMNVCAVKTLYQIGGSKGVEYLRKFGISTIDSEADSGVATALGGITYGVSNLELCGAYSTIANGGTYMEPILYTKVYAKDGTLLYDKSENRETHEVLSNQNAWLLTQALLDVVNQGTGTACQISGTPVAGKTGTTTDTVDLWFAGYVPGGLCGTIWTGYDSNNVIVSDEVYHETLYSKIMSQVCDLKGLSGGEFTQPDGIVQAEVCTKSGKMPTDACRSDGTVVTEYFAEGTQPTEECTTHYYCEVCSATGLLPVEGCTTEWRVCIQRPMDVTGSDPTGTTADSAKAAPTEYCTGNHKAKKEETTKKDETTKKEETTKEETTKEETTAKEDTTEEK